MEKRVTKIPNDGEENFPAAKRNKKSTSDRLTPLASNALRIVLSHWMVPKKLKWSFMTIDRLDRRLPILREEIITQRRLRSYSSVEGAGAVENQLFLHRLENEVGYLDDDYIEHVWRAFQSPDVVDRIWNSLEVEIVEGENTVYTKQSVKNVGMELLEQFVLIPIRLLEHQAITIAKYFCDKVIELECYGVKYFQEQLRRYPDAFEYHLMTFQKWFHIINILELVSFHVTLMSTSIWEAWKRLLFRVNHLFEKPDNRSSLKVHAALTKPCQLLHHEISESWYVNELLWQLDDFLATIKACLSIPSHNNIHVPEFSTTSVQGLTVLNGGLLLDSLCSLLNRLVLIRSYDSIVFEKQVIVDFSIMPSKTLSRWIIRLQAITAQEIAWSLNSSHQFEFGVPLKLLTNSLKVLDIHWGNTSDIRGSARNVSYSKSKIATNASVASFRSLTISTRFVTFHSNTSIAPRQSLQSSLLHRLYYMLNRCEEFVAYNALHDIGLFDNSSIVDDNIRDTMKEYVSFYKHLGKISCILVRTLISHIANSSETLIANMLKRLFPSPLSDQDDSNHSIYNLYWLCKKLTLVLTKFVEFKLTFDEEEVIRGPGIQYLKLLLRELKPIGIAASKFDIEEDIFVTIISWKPIRMLLEIGIDFVDDGFGQCRGTKDANATMEKVCKVINSFPTVLKQSYDSNTTIDGRSVPFLVTLASLQQRMVSCNYLLQLVSRVTLELIMDAFVDESEGRPLCALGQTIVDLAQNIPLIEIHHKLQYIRSTASSNDDFSDITSMESYSTTNLAVFDIFLQWLELGLQCVYCIIEITKNERSKLETDGTFNEWCIRLKEIAAIEEQAVNVISLYSVFSSALVHRVSMLGIGSNIRESDTETARVYEWLLSPCMINIAASWSEDCLIQAREYLLVTERLWYEEFIIQKANKLKKTKLGKVISFNPALALLIPSQ